MEICAWDTWAGLQGHKGRLPEQGLGWHSTGGAAVHLIQPDTACILSGYRRKPNGQQQLATVQGVSEPLHFNS